MHTASTTPMVIAPPSLGLTFATMCDRWDGEGPHPRDLSYDREPFRRIAKQYFSVWEREGILDYLLQQDV